MDYFIGAYRKYADFSGRARRKEYWLFTLFFYITFAVLAGLDELLGIFGLAMAFFFFSLVPYFSITCRRLHDIGRSGWWQLITILPFIGPIILLVFLVLDSEGDNAYGPRPKFESLPVS
ncbi:MAG: hypothetical protein CME36_00490 [unclassified Hahellaceae]|nr:hypothetical protein [Hahellaceae bacterium]|tara:strand:+ start:7537 stop:7893 length:357 start_codon:yes stop_codon:yes gene_type:complete